MRGCRLHRWPIRDRCSGISSVSYADDLSVVAVLWIYVTSLYSSLSSLVATFVTAGSNIQTLFRTLRVVVIVTMPYDTSHGFQRTATKASFPDTGGVSKDIKRTT